MKLYYKSLLLVSALLLCVPFINYAAFPVKKMQSTTFIANPSNTENTGIGNNLATKTHRTSFVEKTIQKIYRSAESRNEHLHQMIAIILAVFSVLCGGLGLQRFFLGYIGAGFLQLSGVACAFLGVFLIVSASAGAALIIPGTILVAAWLVTWIWSIVDLIRICTGDLTTKHRIPSSLFWYR